MAEMALGYGSEYQLLRFLGHHRGELNSLIMKELNVNTTPEWLDYPYEEDRLSGDGELKGIECFENLDTYASIKEKWESFWPTSGNAMNWDGIFILDGVWYFVEAKANEMEAYQKCSATSEKSIEMIDRAFSNTKEWIGVKNDIDWTKTNCYQLANRLAFIYFCNQICAIPARLLYIGFIYGYRHPRKDIRSAGEWEQIWENEYQTLGVTEENLSGYLYQIYPNCLPKVGDNRK